MDYMMDDKREKIQQLIDDQSLNDQSKVFKLLLFHYGGEIDWPTYVHYCGILYSYFLANAKTPYERSIFEKDIKFFRNLRDKNYDKQIIDDFYKEIDRKKLRPF